MISRIAFGAVIKQFTISFKFVIDAFNDSFVEIIHFVLDT